MHEVTLGAITAAWHENGRLAEHWFDLLKTVYGASESHDDWPAFWQAFAREAALTHPQQVIEAFEHYLEYHGSTCPPMTVIGELDAESTETLTRMFNDAVHAWYESNQGAHSEAHPEHPEQESPEREPIDHLWSAYLARWQGHWDGADGSWTSFAERFVFYAAHEPSRPDELRGKAQELVDQANSMPLERRHEFLQPLGIMAVAVAEPVAAATASTEETPAGTAEESVLDDADIELVDQTVDLFWARFDEAARELAEQHGMTEDDVHEALAELGDELGTEIADAIFAAS